jgi:hypothetical protein
MTEHASTAITLTLWNKWVPVRRETTADGMTSDSGSKRDAE